MSSSGRDMEYFIKRQKNNEAARLSRNKRKEKEIAVEKQKKQLETAYLRLHKEIIALHKMRLDALKERLEQPTK